MSFAARYPGRCAKCSEPITVGQQINWNRLKRGEVYHATCSAPDAKLPHPDAVPTSITALRDTEIKEFLDKWLKAANSALPSKPAATVETSSPEEPTAEDMAATIVPTSETAIDAAHAPTAEPTRKPKAPKLSKSKLTPSSLWYDVLTEVIPHTDRILLIGPPSSGKSTTTMITASITNRVTMTETTSREDLIGMFHLIDGATKWIDGPFTSAMRSGKPILVDEIDRYSPECASLLYSLIDDKPHICLPSGETVYAADGYKVIMTSNEGLDTLPPAVQDRIEVIIMANVPHEAALVDIPTSLQSVVYAYYRTLPCPPINLPPSVRRMRAFHRLSQHIPHAVAARLVFGDGSTELMSTLTSAESI